MCSTRPSSEKFETGPLKRGRGLREHHRPYPEDTDGPRNNHPRACPAPSARPRHPPHPALGGQTPAEYLAQIKASQTPTSHMSLVSRSRSFYLSTRRPHHVMAALDAAIHVFARRRVGLAERDARIESGHDECWRGSVGETAHRPNRMRMNFGNMTLRYNVCRYALLFHHTI